MTDTTDLAAGHGWRAPMPGDPFVLTPSSLPMSDVSSADPAYVPRPIDTASVSLPTELTPLLERLAENVHDHWARQRLADGWTLGPARDDAAKTHPGLVPYAQLPEGEKTYDRVMAEQTLRAIVALGYRIVPPEARE